MIFSIEDFKRIRDHIYKKTGLFFEDRKLYFLQKRIEQRIKARGLENSSDYFRELQFRDPQGTEIQALLNSVTTNETYFFREFDQLAAFAEHCLPEICQKKITLGSRKLKIWCAGCSTGEEAYTLGIILKEMLEDVDNWYIEIFATDINSRVMDFAKRGAYEKRAVKDVPPEYMQRWFTSEDDKFLVSPNIKKMCHFEMLNLMDFDSIKKLINTDFIFCRNVLIYFDTDSRRQVVDRFYEVLNPGGYIFLGHSESMTRISSAFTVRRKEGFIVYQKPD